MKNKKAGMELSINMIVVLIIAVIIMGLAIGFITYMFTDITNKFDQDEPDATGARASQPLTSSRGASMTVSAGSVETINWGVYCNKDGENACKDIGTENKISFKCSPTDNILSIEASTSKSINYTQTAQVMTLVKISSGAKGTYLCTVTIGSGGTFSESMDFSVTVT